MNFVYFTFFLFLRQSHWGLSLNGPWRASVQICHIAIRCVLDIFCRRRLSKSFLSSGCGSIGLLVCLPWERSYLHYWLFWLRRFSSYFFNGFFLLLDQLLSNRNLRICSWLDYRNRFRGCLLLFSNDNSSLRLLLGLNLKGILRRIYSLVLFRFFVLFCLRGL